MTNEQNEPYYKDHAARGGLKLRAMFSTDAAGRNTLELVCHELRTMDADCAEGFLALASDRINETRKQMRSASPDGKIDCVMVGTKPGHKPDRITLKGDNDLLLEIANKHGDLQMSKEKPATYAPSEAFKAIADKKLLRDVEHYGPDYRVEFAIQLKPKFHAKSLEAMEALINQNGKPYGVGVNATRPYDPARHALYIDGPLQHVAAIAAEFGSKAAVNINALMSHDRSPATV